MMKDVISPSRLLCSLGIALVAAVVSGLIIVGCDNNTAPIGSYSPADQRDCLPDLTLTDQTGSKISLASLKGKPVLFDFIYATCPGPCLVLTTRMKAIADAVGPLLGSKTW